MKYMYDLKEKLHDALDEIGKKSQLTAGDLDTAHKLAGTIKDIDKICMLEEEDYSEARDGYGRGSSYANRGQHYVRGHYSRDGGRDGGMGRVDYSGRRDDRGRYSRGDGRSEMMEHLEMALDTADEQDREMIRRMMKQIEKA